MRELERNRDAPDTGASTGLRSLAVIGAGRTGGSVTSAARAAGLDVRVGTRGTAAVTAGGSGIALLCVPDESISAVCAEVAAGTDLPPYVGHVSGATGLDALESAARRGAQTFRLHPLQTIPAPGTSLTGVPAAVTGSTPAAAEVARTLARRLGMVPFDLAEEHRAAYHAGAVLASNFVLALAETAADLLTRAGVKDARAALTPLVLSTAANWAGAGPAALTGPIARGDEETVRAHQAALADLAPELSPVYTALADRTRAVAANQHPGGTPVSTPKIVRTREELRAELAPARRSGARIGLVPTMGFLHEGHASLLRAARERCDVVVMSLFVNPTQFGPNEDLAAYPRDEAADLAVAAAAGVDLVYAPAADHVYPPGFATTVEVGGDLTSVLCGDPARRGAAHFRGVTTVVAKLLNAVGPDVAFFGQKDAQQAIVVQAMVRDLELPVEIVVLPTVREPDGLAMSSRNVYLTAEERVRARALNQALTAAARTARNGSTVQDALAAAGKVLADAGIEPEYLEARDAGNLTVAERFGDRPVLIAVAARVGRARLIDNQVVEVVQGA
ncbi:pantoate--beta-alanine ligase [Actinopolymorpha singaporensis]|uniref:Pantothenate synthetase n=1 Tax=Actinopolymorpha singaporensis TaxID=117157 RepID=A0A1H1Y9I8_9ACTN|nr:pantoate--beta-alanine ligase [Actinopolymorpha singaporensis]SDT18055.1 pantoate--beta-alanine ligase [Actinopolymorpha singaporensis]